MRDYLLEAFPNPKRNGCPDEQTIQALAERRLPLRDPAMLHIASCSECYAEYRERRLDMEERGELTSASEPGVAGAPQRTFLVQPRQRSAKWMVPTAVAASLLCGIGGYGIYRRTHTGLNAQLVSSTPILANVDLFNATTLRGGNDEPQTLQEVSLPQAVVNLAVTLPRFSQSGSYTILVAKDRAGKQVAAEGHGTTSDVQGRTAVSVTLDLRRATPGAYFLATVRGSDNGTYYYPLKVR